jgi:hypothetical protein
MQRLRRYNSLILSESSPAENTKKPMTRCHSNLYSFMDETLVELEDDYDFIAPARVLDQGLMARLVRSLRL